MANQERGWPSHAMDAYTPPWLNEEWQKLHHDDRNVLRALQERLSRACCCCPECRGFICSDDNASANCAEHTDSWEESDD